MRLLFIFNLLAIVVIAGSLGRLYEGTPLPANWRWHQAPQSVTLPASPLAGQESNEGFDLPLARPERDEAPAASTDVLPAKPKLRFLTEGDYPPFSFRKEGKLVGFDVEIAEAICTRLERECSIASASWPTLLPALKTGKTDAVIASLLIPTEARESVRDSNIAFTRRYYSTPARFAVRSEGAGQPASPNGKRVAVQADSIHAAYLRKNFPAAIPVETPTLKEAEAALADGRADLVFADRNALLVWLKSREGACCRLIGTDYGDTRYFGLGAGIALRAGDTSLRDEMDAALQNLMKDGTYARISNLYFGQTIR